MKMNSMRDVLGFILGAAVTAACFVLLLPPAPSPCGILPIEQELTLGPGDDKLLELLRRASMDDKTVIITFTNEAWTAPGSLQDLFLESFRQGVRTEPLLKHLVIIAGDAKAYEQCLLVHPLCYHFRVDGGVDYTEEQTYMAKGYLEIVWRKNRIQTRVLQLGYNFVFTDMDILWLRNPLLRIPIGADLTMSSDNYYGDNPYDINKMPNSWFMYAKASARMVAFFESWYTARLSYPDTHEQHVFLQIKDTLPAQHEIRLQFVDTAYFTGFCELRKDFYKVCTVHGNCVVGLQSKLEKLTQVLDEWKHFREMLGSNNTTAITD